MENQVSILIKEFFYSQGGFFAEDPELQAYCLLIENGEILFVDSIHNYLVNEISRKRGAYQEIELNRTHNKILTQGLIEKIEKEEDFTFVHMLNGLDYSSLPKKIKEKIYPINLERFNIKPDFKSSISHKHSRPNS